MYNFHGRTLLMKKQLAIIITLLILALAIGFGVYHYLDTKTKFNGSYVNGNTAGNLYNEGLFCEYGDYIYFANPSDGGKLYSMRHDGSELTLVSDDVATYINADANYLYYVRNNPGSDGSNSFSFLSINTDSLVRVDHDGEHELILDTAPSLYASLVGDYVYYIRYDTASDTSSLYKVKLDGSEKQLVRDDPFFTCSTNGQYIYYNGTTDDHYIWRLDTNGDSEGMLYGGNCWMPDVVDDTTAYFMDCDDNYRLAKVDLASGEKTTLCDDRIDWFNVDGDVIYFQSSDSENPALCRINTDGTGYEELVSGNHMNINTTSDYIYFCDYSSGQMFRLSTAAGASAEVFAPGKITE